MNQVEEDSLAKEAFWSYMIQRGAPWRRRGTEDSPVKQNIEDDDKGEFDIDWAYAEEALQHLLSGIDFSTTTFPFLKEGKILKDNNKFYPISYLEGILATHDGWRANWIARAQNSEISLIRYITFSKTDLSSALNAFKTRVENRMQWPTFYRGGGNGERFSRRSLLTLEDIVAYEHDELGNEDVTLTSEGELYREFPANRGLSWVCFTYSNAESYGDPVEEIFYDYPIVLATDGYGGALVAERKNLAEFLNGEKKIPTVSKNPASYKEAIWNYLLEEGAACQTNHQPPSPLGDPPQPIKFDWALTKESLVHLKTGLNLDAMRDPYSTLGNTPTDTLDETRIKNSYFEGILVCNDGWTCRWAVALQKPLGHLIKQIAFTPVSFEETFKKLSQKVSEQLPPPRSTML